MGNHTMFLLRGRTKGLLLLCLSVAWAGSGCSGLTASNNNPGTPPPPINISTNPATSSITASGATVSWGTNVPGTSQVDYGPTTSYGSSSPLDSGMVTSHSEALGGLTASTTYHYRVKSKDGSGTLATSGDFTFTTTASNPTPPVISGVTASSITTSGAMIGWTTNVAADSQVEYGTTTSYGQSTAVNANLVTSHSEALGGLTASTLYHYRVKSKDGSGTLATSGDFTFMTTASSTPPVISNVTASNITSSGATIGWTTNVAADSQVEYGTTASYGQSTAVNANLVTSHSMGLTGLTASTLYHYRVKSKDASGNLATSGDSTLTTAASSGSGRIIQANPTNYDSILATLQPGDTMVLASGNYPGLFVSGLNGTPSQPITIAGASSGSRPVILGSAGQNTLQISNSSYLVITNLEVNPQNLGGDGVNAQGTAVHHITLDGLFIHGFHDDQASVGISTNGAVTWNWTIRNCVITDGGTGMYLGNSDGNEQFIAGLLENNLVYDTLGYNIEIKYQNPLPSIPGIPTVDTATIVRNNVFSKANNAATGANARPNLLVDHFPLSGPGQNSVYLIYGNFLYQNPTGECLFQGEGNVALYDNLFFNSLGPAACFMPHNDVPRMVRVFNNTVVSSDTGISISGGSPQFVQSVIGNAVFAANPISAPTQASNITDTFQNAQNYLNNPMAPLGTKDLYPKPGKLTGSTIDSSSFNQFQDWNLDFNCALQNGTFRGAYAAEGTNPGWLPKIEIKPQMCTTP